LLVLNIIVEMSNKIVKNGSRKEGKKMETATVAAAAEGSGIPTPAGPGTPAAAARASGPVDGAEGAVAVVVEEGRAGEFNQEFARGKRVTCGKFNGKTYVHVREYKTAADQKREYPTEKGVALTPVRVKVLRDHFDGLDEALRQLNVNSSCGVEVGGTGKLYEVHLGGGFYATVNENFNGVDLRRYFVPAGQSAEVPSRNGIFVPFRQWTFLKKKIDELISVCPEIRMEEPHFHQGQLGMMECSECSPFGWAF
jgi:hypothetical protein